MIVDLRNKKPFIHFGFNRQEVNSFSGNIVKVYQDTLYNESYSFSWSYSGGVLVSENANELVLQTDNIELITVSVNINGIESEEITLDSKAITWATKEIFFNNTEITFDTL